MSSKPKFTKGKWSVGTGKLEGGVVDKENELICDPSGGRFEEEAKANAALIAAAPEMYWMLEKCRTALRECGMTCLSEDVFLLLKKARGEE